MEPLTTAESAWVEENVAAARSAIGADPYDALSAESLDHLWASLRSSETGDPNDSINLVGLAFGQLLVDRFDLEWVMLTDEDGSEIAVRGPSDFTVFPTNLVAKRYESGETGFLEPLEAEMARMLRKLA